MRRVLRNSLRNDFEICQGYVYVLKSYHEGDVYITELELDMKTLPFLKVAEFNPQGDRVIKVEQAVYY